MELGKVIIVGQNPSSVEKSGTFKRLNQWTAEWKINVDRRSIVNAPIDFQNE